MLKEFSYHLSDNDNIQEAKNINKKREAEITKIIEDKLSAFKNAFEEQNITYEIRFLQGDGELEIFGLEPETTLLSDVENAVQDIPTLINTDE